jgi:hypothetical protein
MVGGRKYEEMKNAYKISVRSPERGKITSEIKV